MELKQTANQNVTGGSVMETEIAKRQGNGSSNSKAGGMTTRLKKSIDSEGRDPQEEKERKYLRKIQESFLRDQLGKMRCTREDVETGKTLLKLKTLLGKEDEHFASYLSIGIPFMDMKYVQRCMKMAKNLETGTLKISPMAEVFLCLRIVTKKGLIRDFLLKHGLDTNFCWSDDAAVTTFCNQIETLVKEHMEHMSEKRKHCKICYPER